MERIKWNNGWKVWKEDNAFRLIFSVPQDAAEVELPYDAVFHGDQSEDCVNAGRTGFLPGGVYNYYKECLFPEEEKGKTVQLYFAGIGGKSFVYVNGSLAGECDYAYTGFHVDISNYLKYGEVNQILVLVHAMDSSSRYYAGGGIYRDVYLLKGAAVHIVPDTTKITTLEISEGCAFVQIDAWVQNCNSYAEEAKLKIDLFDLSEEWKFGKEYLVRLPGQQRYHFSKKLLIRNAEAWEENNPVLYNCNVVVWEEGGCILDVETVMTGFRTLRVDAVNGLLVNGKEVKLRGACVHHDQGLLGGETYDAYEHRRIGILKAAGFNAVRSAHNPASVSLLKACDKHGVYVMDEAFDMWARMKNPSDYALFFEKGYKEVLEGMVNVDYNHPSVIMYSTGNEITDAATDKGYELSNEMTNYLHQLDPCRYVTNGINGIFAAGNRLIQAFTDITGEKAPAALKGDINECMSSLGRYMNQIVCHEAIGDLLERLDGTMDIVGYNYMTARYEEDCRKYKNRVIVGTETYPRQIAENWVAVKNNKAVIGDFTWTGYDYLGETGDNYPDIQNFSGDIDALGERKPVSYYREIVFGLRKEPYIAVRPPELTGTPRPFGPWQLTDAISTWNFPRAKGEMVTVEIYSSSDEVELFLNEQSLGRKSCSSEFAYMYTFDVQYEEGVLRAVSYIGDERAGEYLLETTGRPVQIDAEMQWYSDADQNEQLIFIPISILDAEGRSVLIEVNDLKLTLTGQAKLLAFGSRGLKPDKGYRNKVIHTDNGKALAIIKKQNKENVFIKIEADGLKSYEAEL